MTAEYMVAVHAAVFLNHKKEFVSSDEIAKNVCTNPARVRKILSKLEKAGIVEGRNGAAGGYRFAADPTQTDLLTILDALDEKLISVKWRSGNIDMDCQIASGMAGVMDDIFEDVNDSGRKTLSDISISDIDHKIFTDK